MATKIKMIKLLHELNGCADLSRAPAAPKNSAVYLMPRPYAFGSKQPKRRATITVSLKDPEDIPSPVKITHCKARPTKGTSGKD